MVIFLTERHVVVNGGKLKATGGFKHLYKSACEPDVFFEVDSKMVKGNQRSHQRQLYVVEVETHASTESRQRKWFQYKESLAGITDLIVLDLGEIPESGLWDWAVLELFIRERMPI